ncbi:MAG TPA: hypothetical protein VM219_04350 [Phycisphaerae bacterium]|nr:hypothetical protein [Phycisphaerae bacterium]
MSTGPKVLLIAGAAMAALGLAYGYGSMYVAERGMEAYVAETGPNAEPAEIAERMLIGLCHKAVGLGAAAVGIVGLVVGLILAFRGGRQRRVKPKTSAPSPRRDSRSTQSFTSRSE